MLPGGAAPGLGGSSREGPSEGCVRPRSLPPPSLSLLLHSLTFQNSASPTAIPWMSANSETSLPQAVGRQALFQCPSQAATWDTREGDLAAPLARGRCPALWRPACDQSRLASASRVRQLLQRRGSASPLVRREREGKRRLTSLPRLYGNAASFRLVAKRDDVR